MWSSSTIFRRGYTVGENRSLGAVRRNSGVIMAKRLGDGDGQAIDLVLDRGGLASGQAAPVYVAPGNDGLQTRVKNVEKILKLLARMPEPEVPADLAARTMSRIDQSISNFAPAQRRPYPPSMQDPGRRPA